MELKPKDDKFLVDNPEVKYMLEEIGNAVGSALPKDWDYTLFIMSPENEGNCNIFYTSSTSRDDNVTLMKQWVERNIQ